MSKLRQDIETTKKICAITMVRNDHFFLKKWVGYYGAQLGVENLYIYFDGEDQLVPDFCQGANITHKEKIYYSSTVESEKKRLAYLSDRAAELFKRYDIVIGTDADEFLVIEPSLKMTLKQYLSSIKTGTSVSGLGIDIGQHLNKETQIDLSAPLLGQRRFGYLSTRYTKPNTLLKPARWGSGFHRVKFKNYNIDNNLFLFHFGSMDYKMLEDRNNANGWSARHLRKRANTILTITNSEAIEWEEGCKIARAIQRIFRLIHAPNKPSMAGFTVIVEVPDRFKGIV